MRPDNDVQVCVAQVVKQEADSCEPCYYEYHESSNFNV